MALDPSIILSGRMPSYDLAGSFQAGTEARRARTLRDLAGLQYRDAQAKSNAERIERERGENYRRLLGMASTVGEDGRVQVDRKRLGGDMLFAGLAPEALTAQTNLDADEQTRAAQVFADRERQSKVGSLDLADRRRESEARTLSWQDLRDQFNRRYGALQGVTDQAGYTRAVQDLASRGDNLEGLPFMFNREQVDASFGKAMTYDEAMAQKAAAEKAASEARTAAEKAAAEQARWEAEQALKIARDGEIKRHNQTMERIGWKNASRPVLGIGPNGVYVGRPLPTGAVDKLTQMGNSAQAMDRILTTFKPEFTTRAGDNAGKVQNWLQLRGAPDTWTGADPGQAQWWQDYAGFVNEVRNDLFGASLTPGEKAEFNKIIVTPGMDPDQAKANLVRQNQIKSEALARVADTWESGGYNTDQIRAATQMQPSRPQQAPGRRPAMQGAPPSSASFKPKTDRLGVY